MPFLKSLIRPLLLTLMLTFGMSYAYAAWNAPSALPPSGNIDTPVNTGSVNQVKTGGFGAGSIITSVLTLQRNGTMLYGENGSGNFTFAVNNNSSGNKLDFYGFDSNWFKFLGVDNTGSKNVSILPGGSGNVGIGTAAPAEKLEVAGNIKASGTICDSVGCIGAAGGTPDLQAVTDAGSNTTNNISFANGKGITSAVGAKLQTGAGGNTWQVFPGNATAHDFMVNNFDGSNALTVNGSGYVGVGTGNPNTQLSVGANGSNTTNTIASFYKGNNTVVKILSNANNAGSGPHLHLMENNPNLYGFDTWYDSGTNVLNIDSYVNNTKNNVMTLKANGRVGIGTTVPVTKLDVNGSIASKGISNNGTFYSRGGSPTSGGIWLPYTNGNSYLRSPINYITNNIQDESGQWHINTAGDADFAGNVGIGTTAPSTKFEVVGGPIKATGGLIIETRTNNPPSPVTGQMWLCTGGSC